MAGGGPARDERQMLGTADGLDTQWHEWGSFSRFGPPP